METSMQEDYDDSVCVVCGIQDGCCCEPEPCPNCDDGISQSLVTKVNSDKQEKGSPMVHPKNTTKKTFVVDSVSGLSKQKSKDASPVPISSGEIHRIYVKSEGRDSQKWLPADEVEKQINLIMSSIANP